MPPPSTQLFAEHLPTEWIQHFLTLSAHATVRRLNLSVDGEAGMNLLAPAALSPR
ncbi:IS4 family transposase, partial [Escherichia coli]